MRFINLIVALLLLVSTTVFAEDEKSVYTEDKLGIMVTAGHPEFTIKLKSNKTTGYSWFLNSYDARLVQPVKASYEAPTDKKLMGAPGFEVWTFRLKPEAFTVPQQTQIRFVYVRPWDKAEAAKVLNFRVSTVSAP